VAEHNTVGHIGEDIALTFYERDGYTLVERNFRKPYGEIDLIVRKGKEVVFVEVKTLSVRNEKYLPHSPDGYMPEEAVHSHKQHKFKRIIEAYLSAYPVDLWRIDIASVKVHLQSKQARIKVLKDVILE
jgi:putative endonuclease